MIWDLVIRLSGQFRTAAMGGVIGWDLGAAIVLGEALGLPRFLLAEFLPDIEAAAVTALRKATRGEADG